MFDLPIKAEVFCSDGPAGRSTYFIGRPGNREITHLVVKSYLPPFREYIVPIDQVEGTTNNRIILKCTRNDLDKIEPFEIKEYIPSEIPGYLSGPDVPDVPAVPGFSMEPVITFIPVKRQNISPDELALHRGARVKATDGDLGQLDEVLVDSNSMQITHLVVLVGHLFTERKIPIPIAQVDHLDEETIHLNIDRQSIEALPATPAHHRPK